MSILQGANQVAILGGTHVATGAGNTVTINQGGQEGASSAFKDLSAAAAHTALHDSAARFGAPRCHRNTRTKYLDKLELWMLGKGGDYDGKRLIWLHGDAGTGKSAIMQSIVERCAHHAVILGTFFFSRADISRNYGEVLIPTLAYQVARAFPAAMTVLGAIIERDPLIFKASIHTQAYELLVRPFLYLMQAGILQSTSPQHGVFVIDGLDECSNAQKQSLVIQVVASLLCDYNIPISFLVASRPEVAISSAFQREIKLHGVLASISLDENDDAISDIRQFIQDSFLDIIELHPLRNDIPPNWPPPGSIDTLVWKSSGHFIYAATVMKFISSTNEHPPRALRVVEGLAPSRTGSPFAELDALYLHILTSASYSSQVLGIIRHCALTFFEPSAAVVCSVCDISIEDLGLFLSDVQSLVSLSPVWPLTTVMTVRLKHNSLGDFLRDRERSQGLYVAVGEHHAAFLARYFQLVDTAPPAITLSAYSRTSTCEILMDALCSAIVNSTDPTLLRVLIDRHAPQVMWNFCRESFAIDVNTPEAEARSRISLVVLSYTQAVRESLANADDSPYIPYFSMYIQLLVDDLQQLAQKKLHYRIIPALLFSSSPSGLLLTWHLIQHLGFHSLIASNYGKTFLHLRGPTRSGIDPRSLEAIRRMPQSRLSWSSDLAIGMKLILRKLVDFSWTPEWAHPNPHDRWLRRNKPLKQRSLGSPQLSSNFYAYLRRMRNTHFDRSRRHDYICRYLERRRGIIDLIFKIGRRRDRCILLLKAVILYLRKSDCVSDVVMLARRSLPKPAPWFPRLMKRARAEMDAYVLRWEESPDGLLEKAQSLSINNID